MDISDVLALVWLCGLFFAWGYLHEQFAEKDTAFWFWAGMLWPIIAFFLAGRKAYVMQVEKTGRGESLPSEEA